MTKLSNIQKPDVTQLNRSELLGVFNDAVNNIKAYNNISEQSATVYVTKLWNETARELKINVPLTGDRIEHLHSEDYLRMFNEGSVLTNNFIERFLNKKANLNISSHNLNSNVQVVLNEKGLEPLFFTKGQDTNARLWNQTLHGFEIAMGIKDLETRNVAVLQVLAHKTAYLEKPSIENLTIPSLTDINRQIPYSFSKQSFNGIVMWTGHPVAAGDKDQPPLVIYQGTTISGYYKDSIKKVKADTEARACGYETFMEHKDLIERSLKSLKDYTGLKPIVTGHSLGGSMTNMTGLYLGDLTQYTASFNAPGTGKQIWSDYSSLTEYQKDRIKSFANMDDFATWTVRGQVIGRLYTLSGINRFKRSEGFGASHGEVTTLQAGFFITKSNENIENQEREKRVKITAQHYVHRIGKMLLGVIIQFKYLVSSKESKRQYRLDKIEQLHDKMAIAREKFFVAQIENSEDIQAKFDRYHEIHTELDHQLNLFINTYDKDHKIQIMREYLDALYFNDGLYLKNMQTKL
ncbi:MAG: hypothetical protein JHC93_07615 [Parachlamydiales bacterium]|nr:hypothetical protein [Parachlamydiales bacterium]